MSNIYIQEPPSNGKVLMKTSCGEFDIELWSKEAPRACRNFVQLCMEGYYDGTVFHRIIRNFMAQGGDPTGTGEGGESIYGHPFKDEFHSRLRFIRRGLLAMANAGPHDNGSQFFITLGPCEHLQNKHTIFGKVTGDTIYNVTKLGDVETGAEDRPLYPPKIKSTQILANPFDDIIPRQLKRKEKDKEDKKPKNKSKATKNFSLLSFGEEAEEDEEETSMASQAMKNKSKSMHDLVNDPRLSSRTAVDLDNRDRKVSEADEDDDDDEEEEEDEEVKEEKSERKLEMADKIRSKLTKDKKPTSESQVVEEKTLSKKEELQEESRRLREELREGKKRKKMEEMKKHEPVKNDEDEQEEIKPSGSDELAEFHAQKKKFKAMKKTMAKKGSSREEQTLALLAKFQNKLHSAILTKKPDDTDEGRKEGRSREEGEEEEEEEEDDIVGDDWMTNSLQFESRGAKVKDANMRDSDTFTIFDPRNPINKRRREDSKGAKGQKR